MSRSRLRCATVARRVGPADGECAGHNLIAIAGIAAAVATAKALKKVGRAVVTRATAHRERRRATSRARSSCSGPQRRRTSAARSPFSSAGRTRGWTSVARPSSLSRWPTWQRQACLMIHPAPFGGLGIMLAITEVEVTYHGHPFVLASPCLPTTLTRTTERTRREPRGRPSTRSTRRSSPTQTSQPSGNKVGLVLSAQKRAIDGCAVHPTERVHGIIKGSERWSTNGPLLTA